MVEPAVAQVSVYLEHAFKGSALPRRQRVPRARTRLNVPHARAIMACVHANHANTIPSHVPGVVSRPLPVFRCLEMHLTITLTTITTATVA